MMGLRPGNPEIALEGCKGKGNWGKKEGKGQKMAYAGKNNQNRQAGGIGVYERGPPPGAG